MHRLIRTAAAWTAAAALGAGGPGVAPAAAAPRGTLTATEYRELTVEHAAFTRLTHSKRITWNDFYAVCQAVGRSTALLRAIHANCETGVGVDQSLAGFFADLQRCVALNPGSMTDTSSTGTGTTTSPTSTGTATGTATTGTVTTPAGSGGLTAADLRLFACLNGEYAALGRAVPSVYAAQAGLRKQVLARGFTGRCRATLAPSVAQLRALGRFAATSRRLATDVAAISRMAAGSAPGASVDLEQVKRDSGAFSAAGRAFVRLHRPQTLAVCPHG